MEGQCCGIPITAGGKMRKMSFRLSFLLIILFFFPGQRSEAQRKSDIGIFAGVSYYMGDINTNRQFYAPSIAIGPIYRYNFNPRTAVRLSGIYHQLRGNDQDFSDPYQLARGASFSGSYIDLAAMYEFNFMPYQTANRKTKYTLYVAGGPGYNIVLSSNTSTGINPRSHFTIPFSLGFKFNAGKRLSAGVEWSPRKTYNDRIDGVQNIGTENQHYLVGNKDWYNFAGVFFTYKIFNRVECPTYE